MIKFINSLTGTDMLVADDRKEEYLAAGHRLAAISSVNAKETKTVKTEVKKNNNPKPPVKKSAPTKRK